MIFRLFLLLGLSVTTPVPRIPASFVKSSVSCELEFDTPVRRVYPEYNIVTGERFIAQISLSPCSLASRQTHVTSSCKDSKDGTCTDQAAGVVKVDDKTLYYCYTDNSSPKPFTAKLLPNSTYGYVKGGLSEICIDDASKTSYTHLEDQLLYVASGSFETGLKYYNLSGKGETRLPPSPGDIGSEVKKMTGMFVRGDYVYTVYMDKKVSKITRSCKKDLSDGSSDIKTFTVASVKCLHTIDSEQLVFDQVLALEYNAELDKLFILATKKPVRSSVVALCVVEVPTGIDDVFDKSPYQGYDEDGRVIQVTQGTIQCNTTRDSIVSTLCIGKVETSSVAVTLQYTDVFAFTLYSTSKHHLFHFLSGDSIHVYEYDPATGKTKSVADVMLWEEATSLSIYRDRLYLTLKDRILVTDPHWCSYYGKDPVGCVASKLPSCSYSKALSQCLPTSKCTEQDKCVQDLKSGSFSTLFPDGYSYEVRGTVCENHKFYTDLNVTVLPNSSVSTVKSYRDCSSVKPVTSGPDPVVDDSKMFSPREIGLVAGVAGFGALSLFLIAILIFKGNNKVSNLCTSFQTDPPKIKYTADDKRSIVDPTTPTTPSPTHFHVNNGHELVIRNESAEAV